MTDDTAAEFAQGTQASTVARAAGSVELARTLEEQFDGTALPAGWMSNPWATGGAATVPLPGGALLVDGTEVDTGAPASLGNSLEFTADFGPEPFRHVGFAADFNDGPWAIFSTGGGGSVYARTLDANGLTQSSLDLNLTAGAHAYRIDRTADGFVYFVDGGQVAIHAFVDTAIPTAMSVGASDFNVGGGGVSIDSMILNTHQTPGKFTSRKLDAADARVTGLSFAATSDAPSGPPITYETRTAATAAGIDTAAWAPLGAGGAVTSPAAQFAQYRATLSTTVATATPKLNRVDVVFTIDDQAPVVTIDEFTLSDDAAKVTFSSDEPTGVQCSLDGAAFAACSSPAEFSGLAEGPHTIVVRSTDAKGNVGSDTKSFVIDTVAPKVNISDVTVSGAGAKVTFSTDDGAAVVECKLDGGAFVACASPAQFSGLSAGSHTIVVRATDARRNVGSATRAFDVAAPTSGTGATAAGTTTTTPPTGAAQDRTAPQVLIIGRSARVSKQGIAKLRTRCPRSEASCAITVKVKLGGKRVARATLTVPGGATRTFRLRLSDAARSALAARSRLDVTAVVSVEDEAGNQNTTKRQLTLRAR